MYIRIGYVVVVVVVVRSDRPHKELCHKRELKWKIANFKKQRKL